MARRFLLALLGLLAAIIWQTPASVADALVRQASGGTLALIEPEGSLWSGTGLLAAPAQANGRLVPFIQVKWAWRPAQLLRGELYWLFESGGNRPGILAVGLAGPRVEMLRIVLPARYAMEQIPHAVGRAGWRGDLTLFVQNWKCGWRLHCQGNANLQWFGAGSDLFPLRRFGDYQFNVHAHDDVMDLELATQQGDIQVNAKGTLRGLKHMELAGTISGDPTFVGRLPNIAGGVVTPDGSPGRMKFSIRN